MRKGFHPSAMLEAFKAVNAEDSPLVRKVVNSMARATRSQHLPPKSWDANLSYRTYTQLARTGVLQ